MFDLLLGRAMAQGVVLESVSYPDAAHPVSLSSLPRRHLTLLEAKQARHPHHELLAHISAVGLGLVDVLVRAGQR